MESSVLPALRMGAATGGVQDEQTYYISFLLADFGKLSLTAL